MGQELLGQFHPLAHLLLDIAGSVFTALGVVAEGFFHGEAELELVLGPVHQFEELTVEGHGLQVIVDHRDALAHVLQRRRQDCRLRFDLGLFLLDLGDIGVDRDDASVGGAVVGNVEPAAGREPVFPQMTNAFGAPAQMFGHIGLRIVLRLRGQASFRRQHDQVAHMHARFHRIGELRVEFLVGRITGDQAVLRIPQREPCRDRLDRLFEALLSGLGFLLAGLQIGDVGVDRDHPAILGAMIPDLQPQAVA